MKNYKCLESHNSIYIDKTPEGYISAPCCLYKSVGLSPKFAEIEELVDNPYINSIRNNFLKKDWQTPECNSCILKENLGHVSKRQASLKRGQVGIVHWDLRPGNTCNLKCIMCNINNSSKWGEDLDIHTKYSPWYPKELPKNRKDLDWDWIYKKCIDKAEYIYIAGGEPFYMKNVLTFLEKLSKHNWNTEHTRIQIQTNAVSNTPKLLKVLLNFKKLEFSISVDGWGDVNELIRFPTNHNTWLKNVDELMELNPLDIYFNVTVQALNFSNCDTLVSNVKSRWPNRSRFDMHRLRGPDYLSIDCLKPHIIEQVVESTQIDYLKQFALHYKYNPNGNDKMQKFLLELDARRGTDSKKITPWCFE
jgi:hypothetical protein|tara:strand:+ start:5359 stop:6444 length:1086 start_codon:yes stop_codon:yes gene_type:complete